MEKEILCAIWSLDGETHLCSVRRPTTEEKEDYADCWKERIFIGVPHTPDRKLSVFHPWDLPTYKQATSHTPDGATPGCSNRVWLITQEQQDAILREDQQWQEGRQKEKEEEPESALPQSRELPDRVKQLLAHYGSSEHAWDCGDEGAWALLHEYDL